MPRVVFFFIAIALFVLTHVYLARRLFLRSDAFPRGVRRAGAAAIMLAGALSVAVVALPRAKIGLLDMPFAQWSGYVWLGAYVLLLLLTLARDAIFALASLVLAHREKRAWSTASGYQGDAAMSRRNLLFSMSSGGVLASAGAASTAGLLEARRVPRVKEQEIVVKDLDGALEGFTIVQLSDLHIGPTIKRDFVRAVVDQANALAPDLIVITGDLADGLPRGEMLDEVAPLASLRARYGVFYVNGNHEYYWDAPGWIDAVRALGMTPLVNEHRVLRVGQREVPFVIAGVTDYSASRMMPDHTSDPEAALRDAPQNAAFKLLLAHQPKSIYAAAKAGATLQLSGHTHGGQFYPWNIVVGLAHPFSVGLGQHEDTLIYVSCGTGYWGPPLRLGAPSEISHLTLRRG